VDKSDGSITFTRVKQWIFLGLIIRPAHFALNISLLLSIDHSTVNLDRFFAKIIFFDPIFIVIVKQVLSIRVLALNRRTASTAF
jgi:hypothetical protein